MQDTLIKRRGRPPKEVPLFSSGKIEISPTTFPKMSLKIALDKANETLSMYKKEKEAIRNKYRHCEKFQEGAEYKSQLCRAIGHIEATELLIKQLEELLK